jgi:hypothetical protein
MNPSYGRLELLAVLEGNLIYISVRGIAMGGQVYLTI